MAKVAKEKEVQKGFGERIENLFRAGSISKLTRRMMKTAVKQPDKHPHLVNVLKGLEVVPNA